MAGVGVAFKLAAALAGDQEALLAEYCDLLCLGTVADVMPLTGRKPQNGLARAAGALNPKRVGFAALMAECGALRPPITAGTIGYTLAPRINAAGRMGHVEIATELFLTNDAARAVDLASQLCKAQPQAAGCGERHLPAGGFNAPGRKGAEGNCPGRMKHGTRAWSALSPRGLPRNTAVRHF